MRFRWEKDSVAVWDNRVRGISLLLPRAESDASSISRHSRCRLLHTLQYSTSGPRGATACARPRTANAPSRWTCSRTRLENKPRTVSSRSGSSRASRSPPHPWPVEDQGGTMTEHVANAVVVCRRYTVEDAEYLACCPFGSYGIL